jgi:sugar phosphate permease
VRYRWTVLAIGTGAQAAFSAMYLGPAVLAPALQDRFDLSLSETGVLLATVNAGALVTLLAWGLLADRIGDRLVAACGLTGAAAALLAASYAEGVASLAAFLVLAGAAGSSVNTATGRAVMAWFDERERGLALGLRQTAVPVGGGLAAVGLPLIVGAAGVGAAFRSLAAFCLLMAAVSLAGLREGPELPRALESLEAIRHPLRDPRVWSLSVGGGFLVGAQAAVVGFTVLFLHSARGLSTAQAGAVLAGIQALGAAGRIGFGRWSDRSGERIRPLLGIAATISVALALTAALADARLVALVPALILAGAFATSWNGLAFTAAAELAGPRRAGAALGFQQSVVILVNSLTPLVFAPLVAASSWQAAFAAFAVLPLVGLWMLRGLVPVASSRQRRRRRMR